MKRIIFSIFMFCMLMSSALALVQYSGQPQVPYLAYGHVEWNDQMLSGTRLKVTNENTGYSEMIVTDSNGYYQIETGNWLTTAAARPPIQYGDKITIVATDGCGTGDSCTKSFLAMSAGYESWAEVDFSLTGTLSCPPVSCPSCSGGSSGGGSGCYINQVTEEKCNELFPAGETACPVQSCPESSPIACPPSDCQDTVCEQVQCEEKDCPTNLDAIVWIVGGVISVLFAVAGLVLGGYTWFPGLKGLSNYYIQQGLELMKQGKYDEAKKKIDQGLKTMKTAVEKGKEGQYN